MAESTRVNAYGYIAWLKAKKIGENEPGAKLAVHEFPAEYLIDPE